jgi:hypothetical protein
MAWLTTRASVFVLLPAMALAACDPVVGDEPTGDDVEDSTAEEPSDDSSEPRPQPGPKPQTAEPCDYDGPWGGYPCTTDDDEDGTNYCLRVGGEEVWTECSTQRPECEPGEGYDMGCMGSICTWDGEALRTYSWSEPDCVTPLVLSFDGAPIEFSPASAAAFDLSTDGTCMSTDWPTAPWLALDRDGDGMIRDGSELFGSATKMSMGDHAPHGFAALAELDTNGDGKITAADARFHELVLWTDLDGDRIGAYDELRPLADFSIVSIDLHFDLRPNCDGHGNCGVERAAFEHRTPQGATAFGEIVDVRLTCH